MTISVTHPLVLPGPDDADPNTASPSDWNAAHTLTQTGPSILGKADAGVGATTELTPSQVAAFIGGVSHGVDGLDGEDGQVVPGPAGAAGSAGIAGAQGAIGMPGADGDPGDDGMAVPGPQGPTGATGATGSIGIPVTMGSFVANVTGRKCARAGRFTVENVGPFTQKQINAAVIVSMQGGVIPGRGVYGDECEMDQINCAGEIVGLTRMIVRWDARGLVRGNYRFAYMAAAA
jgi:hypothetical protein